MHRIDSAFAEVDKFGSGKNGFTEGSPGTVPATELTEDILDAFQEEIANVIESAGISLSKGTRDQLLTALRGMVGSGSGPGLKGTGGSSNGNGVEGVGGATDGGGVVGTGAGNGYGVVGTGAGTGYGVLGTGGGSNGVGVRGVGGATNGIGVQAQGTGSGAALHVVPQASEASSPTKGDIQIITTNGKIINHNGSAFERQLTQDHAVIADETETGYTTSQEFATSKYTIPAGTLRAGSTIRVSFGANVTTDGAGHKLSITLDDGTTVLSVDSTTSAGGSIGAAWGDVIFTVRSLGATGAVIGSGFILSPGGAVTGAASPKRVSGTLDTTQAIDVSLRGFAAAASTTVLEQFFVSVT